MASTTLARQNTANLSRTW